MTLRSNDPSEKWTLCSLPSNDLYALFRVMTWPVEMALICYIRSNDPYALFGAMALQSNDPCALFWAMIIQSINSIWLYLLRTSLLKRYVACWQPLMVTMVVTRFINQKAELWGILTLFIYLQILFIFMGMILAISSKKTTTRNIKNKALRCAGTFRYSEGSLFRMNRARFVIPKA